MEMNRNVSYVFAVLVFLATANATSAEWVSVGHTNAAEVFVEKTTITPKGAKLKVWAKWVYAEPRVVPGSVPPKLFQSAQSLSFYDCAERKSAAIQEIHYSEKNGGTTLKAESILEGMARFEEIAPDSIGESILEFACYQVSKRKQLRR
jgi:hypothetical protein